MWRAVFSLALLLGTAAGFASSDIVTVRPKETDDVLAIPGIGFTTFQRFNGDRLNEGLGWTEGFPLDYQPFTGTLTNKDHPLTSIAYFRVYWKFVEHEAGAYRWDILDKALATARERGQTLIAPVLKRVWNSNRSLWPLQRVVSGASITA